jgi:hypothetical protein
MALAGLPARADGREDELDPHAESVIAAAAAAVMSRSGRRMESHFRRRGESMKSARTDAVLSSQ